MAVGRSLSFHAILCKFVHFRCLFHFNLLHLIRQCIDVIVVFAPCSMYEIQIKRTDCEKNEENTTNDSNRQIMCRSIASPIEVPTMDRTLWLRFALNILRFFVVFLQIYVEFTTFAHFGRTHQQKPLSLRDSLLLVCRLAKPLCSLFYTALLHRNNNNSRCTVHIESGLNLVESKSVQCIRRQFHLLFSESLALAFTLHLSVDIFSCYCTINIFLNFRSLSSSVAASPA